MFDQGTFHRPVIRPRPDHDDNRCFAPPLDDMRIYEVEAAEGHAREQNRDAAGAFQETNSFPRSIQPIDSYPSQTELVEVRTLKPCCD